MNGGSTKSIVASALSLWLGVLACLLGCATPAKAASPSGGQAGVVKCPGGESDMGDTCCQRNHNPWSSEKNQRHAMSCCPTETALTQKQRPDLPALTIVFVAVSALVHLDASPFDFDRSRENDAIPLHTGRDILQQVHVLRI